MSNLLDRFDNWKHLGSLIQITTLAGVVLVGALIVWVVMQ